MSDHYIDISNDKINDGFDMLDTMMERVLYELELNMFEACTILDLMKLKIQRNNIDQYLLETVTRFQEEMNDEDAKGI